MPVDREQLKNLVDDGLTLEAIGGRFGVSRQRIKVIVDKEGLKGKRAWPESQRVFQSFPGGVAAYKQENQLCSVSGCLNPLATKRLCEDHRLRMQEYARNRKKSQNLEKKSLTAE